MPIKIFDEFDYLFSVIEKFDIHLKWKNFPRNNYQNFSFQIRLSAFQMSYSVVWIVFLFFLKPLSFLWLFCSFPFIPIPNRVFFVSTHFFLAIFQRFPKYQSLLELVIPWVANPLLRNLKIFSSKWENLKWNRIAP